MSCDRWVDKEDVVHIHNGILLSHKNEKYWVICRGMDRASVSHTEWSKSERAKTNTAYECIYVESREMVEMNLFAGQL